MVREQVRKCEVGVGEEQEESKPKDERKNNGKHKGTCKHKRNRNEKRNKHTLAGVKLPQHQCCRNQVMTFRYV